MSISDAIITSAEEQLQQMQEQNVEGLNSNTLMERSVYAGLADMQSVIVAPPGQQENQEILASKREELEQELTENPYLSADEAKIIQHEIADIDSVLESLFTTLGAKLFHKYGEFANEIDRPKPAFADASADQSQSMDPSSFPKPFDPTGMS